MIQDESDSGIHYLLYSKIISEAVPYIEGQLILTTHNIMLLEARDIKDALYVIRGNEEADQSILDQLNGMFVCIHIARNPFNEAKRG